MNLSDIYKAEGYESLKKLAEEVECNPQYLRQIATGYKGLQKTPRRPSPELAAKLIKADSRLTYEDLYSASNEAA